ncbi:hypothetical protein [Chondrinema litorale]|uniref:hypothetical protein n=1 Tax=Chondrinema litorale TaxID=2994555 RepID=UPI002542B01A|nr:hypothetical protein [Chondrinema litorale]UZR93847.1 hypothetical protein OQ292_18530 [Chondrinema litorale]
MRILLLLTFTVLFQSVFAQKNQAKFQSNLPYESLNYIKIPDNKAANNKQYSFKKLKKQNLGSGNKLKLNVAIKAEILFTKINQQIPLSFNNSEVYYNNEHVGNYTFENEKEYFHNTIQLDGEEINWISSEKPTAYVYETAIHRKKKITGATIEWRFSKRNPTAARQGFFINTGFYVMDKSVPTVGINNKEYLFPIGLGAIIPSNDVLGVELAANAIIGNQGSLGAKFDFSFVISNIKFGPEFIYTQYNNELRGTSGGLGFHLGFILPEFKTSRRRR